jgi:hypothetical protein
MSEGEQGGAVSPRQARILYTVIREKYDSGALPREDGRALLNTLVFRDVDGELWTLGAQSGKWYRRSSKQWIEDHPQSLLVFEGNDRRGFDEKGEAGKPASQPTAVPSAFGSPTAPLSPRGCPRCGVLSRAGQHFCTQCGGRLA